MKRATKTGGFAMVDEPVLPTANLELCTKGAAKPKPFVRVVKHNGFWSVDVGLPSTMLGSHVNDRAEVQQLADALNARAEVWFVERYRGLLGQIVRTERKRKVSP